MLETTRLTLKPLTASEVRLHLAGQNRLERKLNLPNGQREVTEPLRSILLKFTIPRLESGRADPLYHTIWIGIDRASRQIVADIKLKGEPDETGTVEIGYGTYPAFQRQGYMTEIVGGLLTWVRQQPGIRRVEAETAIANVASQKVLIANGFTLFDRGEEMLWWEWWPVQPLAFDTEGHLTPYELIRVSSRSVRRAFVTNPHRYQLWEAFVDFRQALSALNIPVGAIWVNGSFTTQKTNPNDIDVVCFIEAALLRMNYRRLDQLRERFPSVHLFFAEQHPANDPFGADINRIEQFKWFSLFGSKNGKPKGFVELID